MKKVSVYLAAWLLIVSVVLSAPETIAGDIEDLLSPVSEKPAVEIVKVRTAWSLDRVHPGSHVILAVIFNIHMNRSKTDICSKATSFIFSSRAFLSASRNRTA